MAEHSMANIIGGVAGVLTTVAFVPQVIKTWRTRRADDLSIGMLLLFTLGVALWGAYGLLVGAMPVIAANGVTLILAVAMVVMKLRC
jgi:MtN3 and saliva related transmembrane protein